MDQRYTCICIHTHKNKTTRELGENMEKFLYNPGVTQNPDATNKSGKFSYVKILILHDRNYLKQSQKILN